MANETAGNGLTIEQPFPERAPEGQLHDVAKLLAGEELEEDDDAGQSGQAAAPAPVAQPQGEGVPAVPGTEGEAAPGEGLDAADLEPPAELDIAAMAAHLGISEAQLYAMKIPMGQDRGIVSFGEVKDAWRDQANLIDRSEAVTEQQNQLMGHQRTLQTTMNKLAEQYGAAPLQEAVAQAEADGERYRIQEQAALLARFPEWRDGETYQAARGGMLTLAQEYQFSEGEFKGVQDHRLVALLNDYAQLRARVRTAKQAAADARRGITRTAQRPGPGIGAKPPAPRHAAIKAKAKASRQTDDMTRAASAIISEIDQ